MRGLFIVFEGVEGSGKSTQARKLADWLDSRGTPHRLTREPGGTAVGEEIRAVMLHGGDIAAETELLLALAARAAHVREVIEPALAAGDIVVCDRYELSTFAYQGTARALGLERVKTLNAFATGGLRPDLTIVLDVPAGMGEARRERVRQLGDRIEQAGQDFHARVAEAYRLLASTEPAVALVDGRAASEAVHASILGLLQARFPETFPSKAG
jgi:dTMP kinase